VAECLIIGGVLMTAGVIAILFIILKPLSMTDRPRDPPRPARPRHAFEFCPACDAPLVPSDRDCPGCGLALDSRTAARLERLRVARVEIRHLRDDGRLDPETADRVAEELARRRRELMRPEERPVPMLSEVPRATPPPLPGQVTVSPEPAVATSLPPPEIAKPPAPPRRPLAEVLGQYMHERNILWGELAGGLLIVGCSIALVLSLWQTLEELPYFTFLLLAAITGAVFGAGVYTLHHWKLTATSRGLLVIALLLTPLNLLLLADPGARGTTTAIDTAVKILAVVAFAGLVRTGGRDLIGTDELPGVIPRRLLLALAVVGPPASLMVPVAPSWLAVWLPLVCYATAAGLTVGRLSRDQRSASAPSLGERPSVAVLVFVGLGVFALFVAWGFLLARSNDLPGMLRHLALPTVLAGLPVLSAGLLVQRRLAEPVTVRATGTGVAVAGMIVLVASLLLAWPDPIVLLPTAAAVALFLGWIAYRDEIVWAYAVAVPCAALAVVLGYHGVTAGLTVPDGVNAGPWLFGRLTAAESGAVLVGFSLVLWLVSEAWARRSRMADGLGYALAAAGVAVTGVLLVTVHGIERPALAAWAHVGAAVGFVAASFRWKLRVVAQFGVWLILIATLWSLWAIVPTHRAGWGLVIAIESLVLAVGAVGLRAAGVSRLGNACRDVAAAAAILAPVLGAAELPGGAMYSATLAVVTASAFVLGGLYREPLLTWVGSTVGLVALVHLCVFTVAMEPWHGALLLALLAHATLATTAGIRVGPELYAEPLRLSGRITAGLALPLLLLPAAGLAGAWVGLALWAGGLWLVAAFAWRERGTFALFQVIYTWAAVLAGFAWVERQAWYETSSLGVIDPRAVQAYGVAVGLLCVAWAVARRFLRTAVDVRERWAELRPSVDQVVLGSLVVGQLLLAAVGVLPLVLAELTPAGATPAFVPAADTASLWGPGAWLVLGLLTTAVLTHFRWPAGDSPSATGPVVGLTVLALTAAVVFAGAFGPQMAAASALRWGMAAVFLAGSVLLAWRKAIGGFAERVGFRSPLSASGLIAVRTLITGAGAVVVVLTVPVAWLGLTGQAPSGPAAGSVFARMGWTASVILPLAAVVVGLAGTALRERSAGYAFAGGWVWTATLAGGYALSVVTSGGVLDAAQQMRIALLAIGGVSVWALGWLSVIERVPGRGLLTVQAVVGLAGMATLAAIPLGLLLMFAGRPLGAASARLGHEGALALMPAALAALWHAHRAAPAWRVHVIGLAAVLSGILAASAATPWDAPDRWLSPHVLAMSWAVCGIGMATWMWRSDTSESSWADRLWVEVLAVGLVVLGVRAGWDDPARPLVPAGTVLFAGALVGVIALRVRSRGHEYLSGLLTTLAAGLVWVTWGPASLSSLGMSVATGLALAGAVWAGLAFARTGRVAEAGEGRPPEEQPGDELLGLPAQHPHWLPPFPHFAASAALLLVLFGLLPTLAGARVDPPALTWGAVAAVGLALGALVRDREARFAAGGLYALGAAAVCLSVAHLWPGPVWLDWRMPVALAGYVLAVSGIATLRRPTQTIRPWLLGGQTVVAGLVLAMSVRTAIDEPELGRRLIGPLSTLLLVPAAILLARRAPGPGAAALRPAALGLGAMAVGLLTWAIPDATWPVPWLHRHGGLFVALTAAAVVYSSFRAPGAWADDFRRVGGAVGALAVAVLIVVLIQQIPHFNPDRAVRKTPLGPGTVFAVVGAILALTVLAIRTALRPDRDPLGPTARGRTGYVYLAELLLVLLFAHVRLNVPQVFVAEAVKFWTFIVMLLAFIGVGLAELFARRGLAVLARPLHRTGVLLPLIPLLAFWARPPALVTEFAEARAPGLQPMLGYLKNLPQHFDTYAYLWFLAGLLYGLIALSRRSFGWALLGALATNAGLWALLSHHQVPAAVHPQAWAIPLALIILVSEHVNRSRLRDDVAAGLRYLGISMIYVSSAADLFIAGIGQSLWLPVILAVLCLAGVVAGVVLRVRAFLYLGIGFLFLDVFSMIWHAAVDRHQTWVWYASGIVLGALILAVFAVLEKRRNDVRELVGRLREWNA
jgi:hypothetical protein